MTREHLHLADIVERILAAPPRPAREIAAARRTAIDPPPAAEPPPADPPRRHRSGAPAPQPFF